MKTEVEFLQSIRDMEKDALSELFDCYARPLFNYVLRYCGDPSLADQIVGDVFGKLLDQLSIGKGPLTNLRAYLYQMAYHLAVDEQRFSAHRAPVDLLESYWYSQYSTSTETENRMEVALILDAMHKLSADQRHVIILRILEGFSIKETATILGKSVASVKVIQMRAITTLRTVLISTAIPAVPFPSATEELALAAD